MSKKKLTVKTINEKCKALKEIEKGLSNKEKDIQDDDEEFERPNKTVVETSLQILTNLSLFNEKRGNPMQDLISKIETLLSQEKLEKM